MKYVVVSVYDNAMMAYGRPIFGASQGAVVRSFSDEVNRDHPENMMFRHPEDFSLWLLGEFNDEDGKFLVTERKVLVTAQAVFNGKGANDVSQ